MVHSLKFSWFSNNLKSKDKKNIAGDLEANGKFMIHLKLTARNSNS